MRTAAFDVVSESRSTEYADEIMAAQYLDDLLAHGGKETGEKPMILRKAAASRHGSHENACLMTFCEAHHFVHRARAVHAATNDKRRPLASIQRVTHASQHDRIGPCHRADVAHRHIVRRLIPIVSGNRDEHGPARLLHGDVISARDCQRYVSRTRWFNAPFHVRLG